MGQFLKNNYASFLKSVYDPNRVFVESINLDRSIMSANALMSGMYPPATIDQIWSQSVSWFPIPVHSSDRHQIYAQACPKLEQLKASQYNLTRYAQLQATYDEFIRNVSNFSGIEQLDYLGLNRIAENSVVQVSVSFLLFFSLSLSLFGKYKLYCHNR